MVLLTLVVITTGVYFIPDERGKAGIDRSLFTVDVAAVDKVVLESKDFRNTLKFDGSQWRLNERYDASPRMITVLFSMLTQVKAKRRAATLRSDSLAEELRDKGVKVSLYAGNNLLKQYYAGGVKEQMATYFMLPESNAPYLVHLPGYKTYVAQLFELPTEHWRSRIAFPFNWRNLKSIAVSYPGDPDQDFQIMYDRDFFRVPKIQDADTARISDYIQEVSITYLDEYVTLGDQPAYDSLAETNPELVIVVADIGHEAFELKLFPTLEGDSYRLGLLNGEDLCLFESARIRKLFITSGYFEK